MSRLPKRVLVNGTAYTVKYVAKAKCLVGAQGCTDFGQATIHVDSGTSQDRQLEVLIHELAHASAEETGVHYLVSMLVEDPNVQELIEEIYVRQMLPTLLATLRNEGIIALCKYARTGSNTPTPKKRARSPKSTRRQRKP